MAEDPTDAAVSLDERSWDAMSEAVEGFEAAWQTAFAPGIAQFLPPADDPLRRRVLVELIKVDQEYRWDSGDRRLLESYQADWPALADHPHLLTELLQAEALTRTVLGTAPTRKELRSRFPALAQQVDLETVRAKAASEGWPSAEETSRAAFDTVGGGTHPRDPTPRPPGHPRQGTRFGRYEVREMLGQGGMGAVYRAYDPQLDREIALKIPRFDSVAEPGILERFTREARAAAGIRHPNICPIYDAGDFEGTYFITMALVEGPTLGQRIHRRVFDPREAARIVAKLARALHQAHQSGILHRDIKPSNVIIDAAGEPLVMDFGLARPAEDTGHLTGTGSLLGTPAYMAPEQARGEHQSVDARTDVYGLGVLLYHMLTGRPPFSSPLPRVLLEIERGKPTRPRQLRHDIDPVLQRVCLRAMAKAPADRYQSAGEMAAALEEYLGSVATESASPPRRRRWTWAAAAAGFLGLLAAVLISVNTGEGTLKLTVNQPDARIAIDGAGRRLKIDAGGDGVDVSIPAGRHQLEVSKPGFTTFTREFRLFRGGELALEARLQPLPKESGKPPPQKALPGSDPGQVLSRLAERVAANRSDHPAAAEVVALRADLVDFRRRHSGSPEAIRAAELMAKLPWPVDSLRREDIPEYELTMAGHGDPAKAPSRLVAILGDSRLNHWDGIGDIAWSPKGGLVASVSACIRLWDASSGRQVRCFSHDGALSVTFDFDGARLLSASGWGNGVKLWDVSTGREIKIWPLDGWLVAVFSPDGRSIAVGHEGTITFYDAESFEPIRSFEDAPTGALAFSQNGHLFAGGSHRSVKVWEMPAGNLINTWEVGLDSGWINSLVFCPGEKLAVYCGYSNAPGRSVLSVRDCRTGQTVLEEEYPWYQGDLSLTPNGRTLAVGTRDGVEQWDTSTWQRLSTAAQPAWARHLAISPDGKTLASHSHYHTGIRLWDGLGGEERPVRAGPARTRPFPLAVSPDGRTVVVANTNCIQSWTVGTNPRFTPISGNYAGPGKIAFSPSGRLFASIHWGRVMASQQWLGEVILWDAIDWRQKRTFGNADQIISVAFGPEDKILAAGYRNNYIKMWYTDTGRELGTLHGPGGELTSVAFSPDGHFLASSAGSPSGDGDQAIRLWDLSSGELRRALEGFSDYWQPIAFSPDGRRLAAARCGLKVWDPQSGELLWERLLASGIYAFAVAFSPDGRTIASAHNYATVRLWDAETGKMNELQLAPGGRLLNVAFTPDGRHLITANGNGTVYVLRLKTYWPQRAGSSPAEKPD